MRSLGWLSACLPTSQRHPESKACVHRVRCLVFTCSVIHLLTHSLAHSLLHSLARSLTHSLTHSRLTRSLCLRERDTTSRQKSQAAREPPCQLRVKMPLGAGSPQCVPLESEEMKPLPSGQSSINMERPCSQRGLCRNQNPGRGGSWV
jgi:hypothetical protein